MRPNFELQLSPNRDLPANKDHGGNVCLVSPEERLRGETFGPASAKRSPIQRLDFTQGTKLYSSKISLDINRIQGGDLRGFSRSDFERVLKSVSKCRFSSRDSDRLAEQASFGGTEALCGANTNPLPAQTSSQLEARESLESAPQAPSETAAKQPEERDEVDHNAASQAPKQGAADEVRPEVAEAPQSSGAIETSFYQLRSAPMQMFNSFVPTASYLSQAIGQRFGRGGLVFSEGKFVARKMCCNCKKSHCLKLYCECFASKAYCSGCNCVSCLNIAENQAQRDSVMQATLERNPGAFDAKIARDVALVSLCLTLKDKSLPNPDPISSLTIHHTRGCHCKKSGCRKKCCPLSSTFCFFDKCKRLSSRDKGARTDCECYQSGAFCTPLCKCEQCKNVKTEQPAEDPASEVFGSESTPLPTTKRKKTAQSSPKLILHRRRLTQGKKPVRYLEGQLPVGDLAQLARKRVKEDPCSANLE